ncbi:MAG: hypothetical protein ACLFTY_03895 [Candidatus Aenigmatarchaeota archaeon]
MISRKEQWRNFLISVLVISSAFTIQDINPGFFVLCFIIVFLSYFVHEVAHEKLSEVEGIENKSELSGIGIVLTLATGILSQGLAVLAIPLITKMRATETGRWLRKTEGINDQELGLVSTSGPILNLIIGTTFLGLYYFSGIWTFWLVSLINFWISVSNLIPIHPFDGGNTVLWGGWLWLTSTLAGIIGIIGAFLI